MQDRFDQFAQQVLRGFDTLSNKLDVVSDSVRELGTQMQQIQETVAAKFDGMGSYLISIDSSIAKIDQRTANLEDKFENLDQKFENLDQRFEKLDQRVEKLDQRVEGAYSGELCTLIR